MRFVVLFAGLVLAGCATPCADLITESSTRTLVCEDGSHLVVTFNPTPNPARVEQVGYPPLELPLDTSSSGYRFASSGAELRGTLGADATWIRPGAALTTCREQVEGQSAPAL
ncbi:MAG: hypothetical protein NW206_18200 [Hyphomonadaceae bacterium]|nr:hypothetical protein [Hyphomonadaceae bacterium]